MLEEDEKLGFWLQDIPYFWCYFFGGFWRVYLLYLNDDSPLFDRPFDYSIPITKTRSLLPASCTDVNRYFLYITQHNQDGLNMLGLLSSPLEPTKRLVFELRMNGTKLHLPFISSNKTGWKWPSFEGLYDLLLLNKIHGPLKDKVTDKITIQNRFSSFDPTSFGVCSKLVFPERRVLYALFWSRVLAKKYPDLLFPIHSEYFTNLSNIVNLFSIMAITSHETIIDVRVTPETRRGVLKAVLDEKEAWIVLPLNLQYTAPTRANHQVLIMLYPPSKSVIYIDPHGEAKTDTFIQNTTPILRVLGLDLSSWKRIEGVVPKNFVQYLECGPTLATDPEGFCITWTFVVLEWFASIKPVCTKAGIKETIREMIQTLAKTHPDFRCFVRGYAKAMEDYGERKIFENDLVIPKNLNPFSAETKEKILKTFGF